MLTPEQIADGWIAHDGGACPVDHDAMVLVKFADGGWDITYAGFWSAYKGSDDQWTGYCAPSDRIIAYRPEPSND